jgi:hypothetical protein
MPNVPKIVLQRLQAPATELHPDADLLTAFAEKSLAAAERDHVVEHLARCGDCREVLSIALPPQVEPQPFADTNVNWLRWPVLRWATVAAGIVLIASLGTLQYRAQHTKEFASNALDQKQAIATTVQSPDTSSQPVPRTQPAAAEAKPQLPRELRQPPVPSTDAKLNPESGPASKKVEAQPDTQSQVEDQVAQNEPTEISPAADRVAKAKPASAQAAPSTLAPAPSLHADPIVMKGVAAPRWIISAAGTLQRSLDGGKTWLDVNPATDRSTSANSMRAEKIGTAAEPSSVIFHSLSVSSDAAEIWAGGSGSALYHSTDSGKNWTRVVPSASGTTLAGDITSIQFSDPRNGTLATSTAEVWITADDGQTWRKQ